MAEPFRTAISRTPQGETSQNEAAQAVSSESRQKQVSGRSTDTPGLYTYKALKGKPYTSEAFKLDSFYNHPEYENLREQVTNVDEWVQKKAKERGLEDKPESYQEIVDEILKQIGKSENEKSFKTFERINKAVEAMQRLEEAKLPQVLNVQSMTADEYKETRAE